MPPLPLQHARPAAPLGRVAAAALLVVAAARIALAEPPTTAPSQDDIAALVAQLSADDFATRENAEAKLVDVGPAAHDALVQAAKTGSPEQRLRAGQILGRLTVPTLPGPAPAGAALPDPNEHISVGPDGQTVDVTEDGRSIHIDQAPDGIHMTVTGFIDGKPATRQFNAADPDALKAQSPEAFALWDQWHPKNGAVTLVQNNGAMLVVRAGGMIMQGGPAAPPPDVADDFSKLTGQAVAEMEKKQFSDQQKAQVLGEIQKVRLAEEQAGATPQPQDFKAQQAFLEASDNLRKQLAAAGLPDPGTMLPPPASSRLGVSVQNGAELATGGGIVIESVQPDSRAERLGLAAGDVIESIDGKPVTTFAELRSLVMSNPRLTLSIQRNGQELTLAEPAPQTLPSATGAP
jgi:hypothetical protein